MTTVFKFGDYEPEEEVITNKKDGNSYIIHKYQFQNGYGAIVTQKSTDRKVELYSFLLIELDKSVGGVVLLDSIKNDLTAEEVKRELKKIERIRRS